MNDRYVTSGYYDIIAEHFNGSHETVELNVSSEDVSYLLQEYRLAFGSGWHVYARGLSELEHKSREE